MKRNTIILWCFTFLMMLTWTALAQEVTGPLPDVDPGAAAKSLFDGIGAKNWVWILAGGGLVLMYLARLLLLPNLTGKPLAWTSTIMISLAAMCVSLLAGADILSAIGVGFTAGLAAGKAWDLIPTKITTTLEKSIKKKQA